MPESEERWEVTWTKSQVYFLMLLLDYSLFTIWVSGVQHSESRFLWVRKNRKENCAERSKNITCTGTSESPDSALVP